MKVIIPVAGLGTRLLPHTHKRQKCLLPVAGKPVLDHIIEPLLSQGLTYIILVTCHLENQIKEYVKKFSREALNKPHFAFVHQGKALGLGHAVFQGLENREEPVLIQLGDVIYDLDFMQFCNTPNHVIAVDEVPDPERFGIVEIEGHKVIKVHEKPENPPTNLAIIGLYYLNNQKLLWEAIKYLMDHNITTKGEIQLADAFQRLIDMGETITFKSVPRWFDCGIPETFLSTNRALLSHSKRKIEGSEIVEPVSIGGNCIIQNSTIGPYVTIMDGAHIVNSKVSDSIVLWNAKIENEDVHHAIVEEG